MYDNKVKMRKKIFFILDWDFAYMLAPIANELIKDEMISNDMNCLNVGRNYYKYLNDGSIKHPFSKIHSLDEVYEKKIYNKVYFTEKEKQNLLNKVEMLEKKYSKNGSLWLYAWADRNHIKEDYFNILYKITVFFEFFEELYTLDKPDLIITNAYASMPHLISYRVATELGIKIVAPELLRIKEKSFLSNSQYLLLNQDIENNIANLNEAREIINDYKDNFERPFYDKIDLARKKDIFAGFKRFLNYSYNYYITKLYSGHTKPNPFLKLLNTEIKPRLNKFYFNKFYKFNFDIKQNEKYLYFPLHMQPEMTTMTNAPYYLNQLFVLETLSKSIPLNYKLYVKEHPNMFGNNKKYFYDFIQNLPNVELFHPRVSSKMMIKNCSAVITITGTVGLEGLILEKPVITIGEVFYNECKLVTKLKDTPITKWYEVISNVLKNYSHNENEVENFLSKVISQSYDMLFVEPGYYTEALEKDNNENLIKSIRRELD